MSGFCEGGIIFLVSLGLKFEWFYSHESNVMHTPELSDPAFLQVSVICLCAHSWGRKKLNLKILAQHLGIHTWVKWSL